MRTPWKPLATAATLALLTSLTWGSAAAAEPGRPADFSAASAEFGVPEPLLLAYSYALTGWQDHDGQPSAQGGFGLMHLTDAALVEGSGRGDDNPGRARTLLADPASNTLARAAALLGVAPERLRTDDALNIRGGAAVLADAAKSVHPAKLADWHEVVEKLSGGSVLADDVFATLRDGALDSRLRLAPQADAGSPQPRQGGSEAECPAVLHCTFLPAAYASTDITNANSYGNYDPANRPADHNPIRYIVIHTTDSSYTSTLNAFQDPGYEVSAHYVIRSSDGAVTQMVHTKDIAWHAANPTINAESIGIEHESYAAYGATWNTDALYRSSATLVRYLAARYHIPLDRQHIIGHDDVARYPNYADSHWDPGPFWDWNRYMKMLGAPQPQLGKQVVTIDPNFATNRPALNYCTSAGCEDLPRQPTNAVLLHTAPSDDSPLIADALNYNGGGTIDAADWSDKAVTGKQYVVAERKGLWTAIWYDAQKAWLHTKVLRPAAGTVVRARPGVQARVYVSAIPEPSEWPPGTPVPNPPAPATPTAIYHFSGAQGYPLADVNQAQRYYARYDGNDVPLNHTIVYGATTYYRISFNHRYMYVPTTDVLLSRS